MDIAAPPPIMVEEMCEILIVAQKNIELWQFQCKYVISTRISNCCITDRLIAFLHIFHFMLKETIVKLSSRYAFSFEVVILKASAWTGGMTCCWLGSLDIFILTLYSFSSFWSQTWD